MVGVKVSLGHLFRGGKCPRNRGRGLPSLLFKVYMYGWLVVQAEPDFATSTFSCFRGDGRDVLPLVRGRRRVELPVLCIPPLETEVHLFPP